MACRSIALFLVFSRVLFAVPNNYGPLETVHKTITYTSVKAITRALPCIPAPSPAPGAYTHDGFVSPPPELPVRAAEHDFQPSHNGSIGYGMTAGSASERNERVCEKLAAPPCEDGSQPQCDCQPWGWECSCPQVPGKTTITHAATATVPRTATIDGGIRPIPTPAAPPMQCPRGYSLSTLIFDDFFDGEKKEVEVSSGAEPVQNLASPFEYRGFTFDPDWALAICPDIERHMVLSCNPNTAEGKHYVSLYYQLRKPFVSSASRRITYDAQSDSSSWEVLSYTLTAFPNPGQIITILLCAWSINDQDAEPSFCQVEYFSELTENTRRAVSIDNPNQELAFIEFTSYDGYYVPGVREGGGGVVPTMGKGLGAVEFMLDDMVVCTPS